MNQIEVEGTRIRAQVGALLSQIAGEALRHMFDRTLNLQAGIPGTLGGAIVMNAGAYGGEMKDVLQEVTALSKEGEVKVLQEKS